LYNCGRPFSATKQKKDLKHTALTEAKEEGPAADLSAGGSRVANHSRDSYGVA